jgi:hypothetical protein
VSLSKTNSKNVPHDAHVTASDDALGAVGCLDGRGAERELQATDIFVLLQVGNGRFENFLLKLCTKDVGEEEEKFDNGWN